MTKATRWNDESESDTGELAAVGGAAGIISNRRGRI